MIDFLSLWAQQVIVAVIIATIIEMILPDNKSKKYIKMIIGMYILFSIISPFLNNTNFLNFEEFDLTQYASSSTSSTKVNQESMDKRLLKLYIDELEKDIKNKVKEEGYIANSCNIDAVLDDKAQNKGINKIELRVSKLENTGSEENNSSINKVEKVKINIGLDNILNNNKKEGKENKSEVSKIELATLRKTLSDYYSVDIKNIIITKD